MPIDVTCTCGKSEKVPDSFAGKRVYCQSCKSKIQIPVPRAIAEDADDEAFQNVANWGKKEISNYRRLAGRTCMLYGGLLLFLGLIVAMAFYAAGGAPGTSFSSAQRTLITVILAFVMGIGLTYLLGGKRIREGSHTAAMVCAVLAGLQTLLGVMNLIRIGFEMLRRFQTPQLLSLAVVGLMVAAFGQLLFYLVKTVTEEMPPSGADVANTV